MNGRNQLALKLQPVTVSQVWVDKTTQSRWIVVLKDMFGDRVGLRNIDSGKQMVTTDADLYENYRQLWFCLK